MDKYFIELTAKNTTWYYGKLKFAHVEGEPFKPFQVSKEVYDAAKDTPGVKQVKGKKELKDA